MEPAHLDSKIGRLESEFASSGQGRRDWKGLWALIKDISGDFRNIRYPSREERQAAWERFQAIVQDIKESQTKDFEERRKQQQNSACHLADIQSLAQAAESDSGLGELALLIATGGASLIVKLALEAMLGKIDDEHQRLKARSAAMKSAWEYLSEHKSEMSGRDKSAAFELLQKTKGRLDADWQDWNERRHEVVAERNRQRDQQRQEKRQRYEEWRVRQREFIERLEGAQEKLESALSHRQEHLEKLTAQYEDAWSDNFRERVEGWIEEERGRISDIEAKLESVRDKLSEARSRLES